MDLEETEAAGYESNLGDYGMVVVDSIFAAKGADIFKNLIGDKSTDIVTDIAANYVATAIYQASKDATQLGKEDSQ